MENNGVQPYASFYPSIQPISHDTSTHQNVYPPMSWTSQVPPAVNHFYPPQSSHVLAWSSTADSQHIPQHYAAPKDVPLSTGENNGHYGDNSQDYNTSVYLSSHTDQTPRNDYYQEQHYHSYPTSGMQETLNTVANVPGLDNNRDDSTPYTAAIQSENMKTHANLDNHPSSAIVEGWDDADLGATTDVNPWDGTYSNPGTNVSTNNIEPCNRGSSMPSQPEALSTSREEYVSNPVSSMINTHNVVSKPIKKHQNETATRIPQISECSDMEMYWKETRQPFYATEAQVENSNQEQSALSQPNEIVNEDQELLLQKLNRQDSTWASPILDNRPSALSTDIPPEGDSVGFLDNSLTNMTHSSSAGFGSIQNEALHAANREATAEMSTQRDDSSTSDTSMFHKAVGAERHKESTSDHVLPNHPATAFQPVAGVPPSKSVPDKMYAKMTPLKISTKVGSASSSSRGASSDPKTVQRIPVTAASNPSAFSSLPSRRKPEGEDASSNRKLPPSGASTSAVVTSSGSTAPSRWQPPVPSALQKAVPNHFKPLQNQSVGASQAGPSGGFNNRERGSPRTLPQSSSGSKSTGVTRPSALPPSNSAMSYSQYSTERYPRRGAGGTVSSPTAHVPDSSMNAQGYGKSSYRPQVEPNSSFARQSMPSSHNKRGGAESAAQSYPWRMPVGTMRPNGPATSTSIKGSQVGSDYGEGGRCPSRGSLCSDELSYSTLNHNLDHSSYWAYPGYPLSPGFSRKQEADMWNYYRQADPSSIYQAYAMASSSQAGGQDWWEQFYKYALANGKSLDELQAFTEQYKQIMMHFQGLFMPKPDRLTPKLYAKPHRIVWANQPGLLLQVPAHLPQEGQPAVVELQPMPSWEEERIIHATFPGPLSREGTLKGEVRAFLRSQLADIKHTMPPQWDSVCLLLTYLDLLVQANGSMEHNEMAKLLMEGHDLRTEDLRPTSQLLAASDTNSQLNIGENERFASLPPSEPPSGRVSPSGGDGGGRISRPQSRATSILSAAADTLLRRQALARQTRGVAGGLAASGLSHYNMEQADRYLDQYRLLIMRNEKLQALEYSCKHGLWGCAFALASQLPNATKLLPTVLARFLHQAMQISDPLQTFHHLLAGQVPAFLRNGLTGPGTSVEWGDWRPHLAMILSAQPQQPQLAIQCMNHLGDNLGAARILYASQLCYIFAESAFNTCNQSEWTMASKSAAKVTLIGADFHRRTLHQMVDEFFPLDTPRSTVKNFEEIYDPLLARVATDLAIQLTEIYEYACSLKQRDFYLPHLVPFKFLYATRLLDAGFVERAFRYCKVVSMALRQSPELYSRSLFQRVISLSERLQFHPECSHIDSFEEGAGELFQFSSRGSTSCTWIEHLRGIYYSYIQMPQTLKTPSSHHSSEVHKSPQVTQSLPVPVTSLPTSFTAPSTVPTSLGVVKQEADLVGSTPLPTLSSIPSTQQPPLSFAAPQPTTQLLSTDNEMATNRAQQLHHSYPTQVAQPTGPRSFNTNAPRTTSDASSRTTSDMGLDMNRSNPSLYPVPTANVNSISMEVDGSSLTGSHPQLYQQQQQTQFQQSTMTNTGYQSMSQSMYATYQMGGLSDSMGSEKVAMPMDSVTSVPTYGQYETMTSYDMQQASTYIPSGTDVADVSITNIPAPTNQSQNYQEHLPQSMGPTEGLSGTQVSHDTSSKQRTSTPTPPSRPRREEPPRDSPPPGLPYQKPLGFFFVPQVNTFTPKDSTDGGGFDYFREANSMMQYGSSDAGAEESAPPPNTANTLDNNTAKSGSFSERNSTSYPQPTKMVSPPAPSPHKPEATKSQTVENDAKSQKDDAAGKPSPNASGGRWLKFPFWNRKNINEVHLPDDNNKPLRYDPVKKIWIDTSAEPSDDHKEDIGPPQMLFKSPPSNTAPIAPLNRTSSRYVGLPAAGNPNGPVSVVPPFGRPMGIPNVFVPPNIHSQERSADE